MRCDRILQQYERKPPSYHSSSSRSNEVVTCHFDRQYARFGLTGNKTSVCCIVFFGGNTKCPWRIFKEMCYAQKSYKIFDLKCYFLFVLRVFFVRFSFQKMIILGSIFLVHQLLVCAILPVM